MVWFYLQVRLGSTSLCTMPRPLTPRPTARNISTSWSWWRSYTKNWARAISSKCEQPLNRKENLRGRTLSDSKRVIINKLKWHLHGRKLGVFKIRYANSLKAQIWILLNCQFEIATRINLSHIFKYIFNSFILISRNPSKSGIFAKWLLKQPGMKLKIRVNNNNTLNVNLDFSRSVFTTCMIVFYPRYRNGCWIWWHTGFGKCLETSLDREDEWIDTGPSD